MKNGYDGLHKYDDIINLPHPISKNHPQMSIMNRAAQFAPFAALTGYEDAVKETARLTDSRPILDEDEMVVLNEKFKILHMYIGRNNTIPEVVITYFKQDEKKEGGMCLTVTGKVKKIDIANQFLIMEDEKQIRINDIIDLGGSFLKNIYDYSE